MPAPGVVPCVGADGPGARRQKLQQQQQQPLCGLMRSTCETTASGLRPKLSVYTMPLANTTQIVQPGRDLMMVGPWVVLQ